MASSGEGSRGGKVIRHTKSGKPVYDHSARNLIVGGLAVNTAAGYGNMALSAHEVKKLAGRKHEQPVVDRALSRKKFLHKAYKEAGAPVLNSVSHGDHYNSSEHSVSLSTSDSATFLHELGHAEQNRKFPKSSRAANAARRIPVLGHVPQIGLEADATIRAVGHAYSARNAKYAGKIARQLAGPLGTYALSGVTTAGAVAFAYGVGKALVGRAKKKKDE